MKRSKAIDVAGRPTQTPRMFSRYLLPLLVAVTLLSVAMQPSAQAYTKTKPRATPAHHHLVIESISADSITISNGGADSKTYKITKQTEITFKGQATTTDQLKAGMRVQVTPDAADETAAGAISANDPPKDEGSPSPKPKK